MHTVMFVVVVGEQQHTAIQITVMPRVMSVVLGEQYRTAIQIAVIRRVMSVVTQDQ